MAHCDRFRAQHETLGTMIRDIKGLVQQKNADAVHAALGKMAGLILVHLAAEDSALYPRMLQSNNEKAKSVAKEYQNEMGGLKQAFSSFVGKWSKAAIAADLAGFMKEADGVFNALGMRIKRENETLYPLADSI